MAMHDRRFQIFISSTFEDLKEERKKAVEVIFERGHIPIALERFSAANDSDLEVIKKVMAECQVYLLILGHRYGSTIPGEDISYTELEYQLAKQNDLLILPFVLKKEEIIKRRKALYDSGSEKDKAEIHNSLKLERFHESIRQYRQIWGPDDEFRFLVLKALEDNLEYCKKPGFVRVPEEKVENVLSVSQNEIIFDIVEQLKSFRELSRESLVHREQKASLARFFRQQYLRRIIDHKVSLFFEAGSTVTYVAKEMAEYLRSEVRVDENGVPNIHITTNSALAYLQFWLKARVPCTTFPWSTPLEDRYGAFYGGVQHVQEKNPDYTLPPLDDEATEEIRRLLVAPFSLTWRQPTLLLSTASGLQLSDEYTMTFSPGLDEAAENELRGQLKKCFGPHVGSYRNKIFKRYLYATGLPTMIFLTGDKIDCDIPVGARHFILDSECTWEDFYKNHPIAFCIGCSQEQKRKYVERFRDLEFSILEGPTASPVTALIARNRQFIERFEKMTSANQTPFS